MPQKNTPRIIMRYLYLVHKRCIFEFIAPMENIYQARDLGHANWWTDIGISQTLLVYSRLCDIGSVLPCDSPQAFGVVCLLSVDPIPGSGCITFIHLCVKDNTSPCVQQKTVEHSLCINSANHLVQERDFGLVYIYLFIFDLN